MAVKLRLTRMGAKKNPFYRIVAIDSRKSRDGQYIEQIGIYNPVANPAVVKVDAEIAKKWLAAGAQPTETVRNILFNAGVIEGKAQAKAAVVAEEAVDAVQVAVDAAIEDIK